MLDIISIAIDLAADMLEFRRLVYTGHRPVVFRKGRGMQQYAEMMTAGDTPLLMLPSLPDAPQNVVPVNDCCWRYIRAASVGPGHTQHHRG